MKSPLPCLLALGCLLARPAAAQSDRLNDFNALGWLVYNGDHGLGPHWELHTEAQVRRTRLVADPQQLLLRAGIAYKIIPRFKISGGYTFVNTYQYGQHPVADAGTYPEHRFYEDVTLTDQVERFGVQQRVRLEQRYLGLPGASGPLSNPAVWQRQNRIRYQLALTFPLQGPTLDDHEWFLTGFDEVFLNFGRLVTTNVFNQNRVALGLGYRVTENFQLEAQYLNQITQHFDPDPATGLPVFEFNNGLRLGITYNLTLLE